LAGIVQVGGDDAAHAESRVQGAGRKHRFRCARLASVANMKFFTRLQGLVYSADFSKDTRTCFRTGGGLACEECRA
jgi:hypothetical protein